MPRRSLALACILALLLSVCGCAKQMPEAIGAVPPEDVSTPEATPTPEPPDPMDGIYPVETQEEAEKVLEQAYEGFITQLTFAFSDTNLSLQDRDIFLQNASNQVLSRRPELKYAYQLACTDGPYGTICSISYMPYKLGYPDGSPEGAEEIRSLADLAAVADEHLGEEEIPIVIRDSDLLVDDMQRVPHRLRPAGVWDRHLRRLFLGVQCALPGGGDSLLECHRYGLRGGAHVELRLDPWGIPVF